MNILIINGPNINMLGFRKEIYGSLTYEEMNVEIVKSCKSNISFFQSNHEGDIIDKIHQSLEYDAIIINAGAYTHYSYAIRDALEIFTKIKVEVHLTNIFEREDFRKVSVIREVCDECYFGEGINSYIKAIKYIEDLS